MVIAEALNEIKDMERRRKQIQARLMESIFVLPDLAATEMPLPLEDQLKETQELNRKIAELKVAVTKTNLVTEIAITEGDVSTTLNLMQLLKLIETFRAAESLYTSIADKVEAKDSRFYSSRRMFAATPAEPIKLLPNFTGSAKDFIAYADECRKKARLYEQVLTKTNWKTEVVTL